MNNTVASDWAVKEIVERDGTIHRLYTFKRKPCKRIVLDSHIARQLAGYVLIEKDLRSGQVWLDEIRRIQGDDIKLVSTGSQKSPDRDRYNLIKGLFVAAVTFYGKAFAQAEGRRVKLDRNQLAAEFHSIHDEAIAFRNNFAAHSGARSLERAKVALVLPAKDRKIAPKLYRELDQPDFFVMEEGKKNLSDLLAHVHEIPLRKMAELEQKILVDEVQPKGYEYWAKL